ncbi:hypothetical protein MPH_13915 [Macrophomina phaseolina MS6]|uniref:HTH CENPB-type domain-containing protein n=1 Tax=Macrophomina phaseolina (strain MS6) TaxID=1126212 RepID=K2QH79_MACPH|nr:hypothetical protein MPH_13915 [Macrophomina phaseolina MS6]
MSTVRAHSQSVHTPSKIRTQILNRCISLDMDPIEAALDDLKSQDPPNYKATAKKFGCCRTTLSRRHRGVTASQASSAESHRLLNNNQERELVEYINKLSERGIPPTQAMVRNFAEEMAQQKPSKNWVSRFVKRHQDQLKSVYLSGLDLSRKNAESVPRIQGYFELVCTAQTVLVYLLI